MSHQATSSDRHPNRMADPRQLRLTRIGVAALIRAGALTPEDAETRFGVRGANLALQPLRHLDTPAQIATARKWLRNLFKTEQVALAAQHDAALTDALTALQALAPDQRTLSALHAQLRDEELQAALFPYTSQGQGPLAELLDSVVPDGPTPVDTPTDQATAEADASPPTPDRRKLLLGLGATALVMGGALTPKQADAQFGFGPFGSGDIEIPGLDELIGLLLEAYASFVPWTLSPSLIALINRVLDLLDGAGGDTVLRTGSVEPAIEASFPTEPVLTPADQAAATLYQTEAIRKRVTASQNALAALVETQAVITMEEEVMIAEAQASGSLLAIAGAILAMQGNIASRIGNVVTALGALGQELMNNEMFAANQREQSVLITREIISSSGDDLPPPVYRRAQ